MDKPHNNVLFVESPIKTFLLALMPRASSGHRALFWRLLFITIAWLAGGQAAWALPVGGKVVTGQAKIVYGEQSVSITQHSAQLRIEWDSFDIGIDESVSLIQPDPAAAAWMHVTSGGPTISHGSLAANGQVFISNPAGVVFGPDANVDVAAIVATSLDIINRDFTDNRLDFNIAGDPTVVVKNYGTINAQELAALVGPGARNAGMIVANTAIIGSGQGFALDYTGDDLVNFAITHPTTLQPVDSDGKPVEALVVNDGTIMADGGTVILTADAAAGVIDNVINLGGVIQARSIGNRNGLVVLLGGGEGTVLVTGTIDASGDDAGETGGTVHVLGARLALALDGKINVPGQAGGGTALIGGAMRGGPLAAGGHIAYVALEANTPGTNISIDSTGTFETESYIPTAEIVFVAEGATITADATDNGDGGTVVVWADQTTQFSGVSSARGGANGGNGGFVETSGAGSLGVAATASINALAPNGAVGDWLLDPLRVIVRTGGTATLAQIADASDTTNERIVDPSSINGATANVSIVASETITFDSAVSIAASGVGLTAQAGNLITINASVSTNNGDISLISDQFDVNAAVNAGTGTVMFDMVTAGTLGVGLSPGASAGGADLDTSELALITAGNLVFGDPTAAQNSIAAIRLQSFPANANISGLVQYNALADSNAFILAFDDQTYPSVEFNVNDGFEFQGSHTITTTAGDAVFNADADATGPVGGFDDLRADDGFAVAINSAANIVVTAPRITEAGTGTISFNANGGAGTITFRRSNAGTIGVGDGASGNFAISNDQLSLMTAATVNFGDPTTPNNTMAIAVSVVTLASVAGIGTAAFNTGGTTTFSGANSFDAVVTGGATTAVETGATVDATGTIAFNTSTVTLDGDLTATNGITGAASIVNVLGSAGGAELQDAVDVAAVGATVNVSPGSYAGFTIDVEDLTVDGFNSPIVNAASPAITIAANGVTVQDMLLQSTGLAGEVGILLDGTAAAGLTGIAIVNVAFSNLDDGIRSQGDIGISAAADVTIRGTSDVNKSVFEDFLDAAIDVGDTDGDAVYVIQDVIVRDGATLATGDDGFRFGAIGGVTANRVDISDATGDGIQFGALDNAAVTISNSSIVGALSAAGSANGLNFNGLISNGSQINISGNSRIESLGGLHGILFEQGPTGAATTIDINGNTLIQSAENQGIVFARGATDVTVVIRGNGTDATNGIRGPQDAISVNNSILINVNFLIGGDTAADGNYIFSNTQGLDIEGISGGTFVVANNDLIQGSSTIEFENAVSDGAAIIIVNNGDLDGTGAGVQLLGGIAGNSNATIAGNTFANTAGDAIQFAAGQTIDAGTITIGSANVTVDDTAIAVGGNIISGSGSGSGSGVNVRSTVQGDTNFNITDNTIGSAGTRVGQDGIRFSGGVLGTATVTIGGTNQVFATQQAIQIDDLQSPTTVSITGGTYNATGGALLVDNTGVAGTDGQLNVGAAAFVGGAASTVFEVITDAGNAGVNIDFSGAATFDGGATGLRLSGPGIDILNNTLGSIAFTNQATNFIELANGAEFLPGSPTVIDATGVDFDGLDPNVGVNAIMIENKTVDFYDNNTLGLIDFGTAAVPTGGSIQLTINTAGALTLDTVVVGSGTYGGSVEVWVDGLTVIGVDTGGGLPMINSSLVDSNSNFGSNIGVGFAIQDTTGVSGNAANPVTGVTIDPFVFVGTGTEIGLQLGTTGSTAVNTTIDSNTFTNVLKGIIANNIEGASMFNNNNITATGQAIKINGLQSPTTLSITSGSYNGTDGALLVDNTGVAGTDGQLNVGAAAFVGGAASTVFEVITDAGNAGVNIDFSGAATFDGGATGLRLSGPGIDILNNTLGSIAFTNQATNFIELANGAEFLPGSPTILDPALAVFDGQTGAASVAAGLEAALEAKIIDFDDDPSLGQIGFSGTVQVHLFIDVDGDGSQTGTEPDLAGVDILVTDTYGNEQTITTDSDGDEITNVAPGTTSIAVVNSTLPDGYTLTTANEVQSITVVFSETASASAIGYQPSPTGDDDGDGINNSTELNAPNNGDGNFDTIPDFIQGNVASLPNPLTSAYMTLAVNDPCAPLENISIQAESAFGSDPLFDYPQGLLGFELPCASATVTVYYHGLSTPLIALYRKFGPRIPTNPATRTYYMLPDVSFGQSNGVATASFTLEDGQLGDDESVSGPGRITDPGGLAISTPPPAAIPTLGEWGRWLLVGLLGGALLWFRRRRTRHLE